VPSSCPICEQPIPTTVSHCTVCGFPTALAIEGLRSAVAEPADGAAAAVAAASAARGRGKSSPAPLTPEEELCAAISRDLRSKLDFVRQLGRGVPDVTSELCQAALIEAEGRVSEALEILRGAQIRLEEQTEELLDRRFAQLQERQEVLQRTGVRFALAEDIHRIEDAIGTDRRDEAGTLLMDAERRIAQFESDWKGLQGLLAQIESLRAEAADLDIPLGEITSDLATVRDHLAVPNLTEEALDSIAQEAAQTLMLLHEAIPTSLEEELTRHEGNLNKYPDDHEASAVARRLHLEATRHLKKGRLSEAVTSVRDLRRQLEILEKEPRQVEAPAAPAAPTAVTETETETLDRLLKKARSLAARVRTLPADSDTARDAAIQIREATELLRDRHLKEADLTLTRLMRMLAFEAPRN
jgi:hypothetical protein